MKINLYNPSRIQKILISIGFLLTIPTVCLYMFENKTYANVKPELSNFQFFSPNQNSKNSLVYKFYKTKSNEEVTVKRRNNHKIILKHLKRHSKSNVPKGMKNIQFQMVKRHDTRKINKEITSTADMKTKEFGDQIDLNLIQEDDLDSTQEELVDKVATPFMPTHPTLGKLDLKIIFKKFPNMPIKFWKKIENKISSMYFRNSSCSPFPSIFDIDVHNIYWQTVHMSNATTIQLYSAFYDKREIFSEKSVRILSMVNRTSDNFPNNKTYWCQIWFDHESQPVIVKINKFDYIWYDYWNMHKDGMLGPYLLGCTLPRSHADNIPKAVSIVENPCDAARNLLSVTHKEPKEREMFSVCVKGLDFLQTDISFRLVEWIELVLLMGVHKIFFYQLEVHPNVKKVLDYYVKLGKADVKKITLPDANGNIPILQHQFLIENNVIQCLDEIIPYNDCFYRNIYSFEYVAMFDIDEIIFPLKDDNWRDLIKRAKLYQNPNTKFNGFTARQILFLDSMQKERPYPNVPQHMHMMQHVFRSQNFTAPGEYVKTIFDTNYTITCHNHWPISTAPGTVTVEFHLDDARMQHYRKNCPKDIDCNSYEKNPVKDTGIWKYKDLLIPRVNEALKNLDLI